MLLGDDHGGEALVGRRDADWAPGNSALANILLLSAGWGLGVGRGFCRPECSGNRQDSRSAGGRWLDLNSWIHQIHAAGGASGSTTMVMMFVLLFVLVVWSRLVVVTYLM